MRDLRVAVIGAGPAGIYASDILTKQHEGARVDLFDRLPGRRLCPGRSGLRRPAKSVGSNVVCPRVPDRCAAAI